MTKEKDRENYGFACALISGNLKTLLGEADLQRVVESRQMDGAMNVLAEFGYGDGKALENPRDFTKVLKAEQKRVRDLVFSILPHEGELDFLQYPSDYHNAKVLLKAEFLGVDGTSYLLEDGSVPAAKMAEYIHDRNYLFLTLPMAHAVEEAVELFAKGRDPQEIDIVLDRACYADMYEKAVATDNDFLIGYVRLAIDLLNLTTCVRLRQMGQTWNFFQKVFLDDGHVSERIFTTSWEEPYNQLAEKLAPYGYQRIMADGGALVRSTGKYTLLEKLCDDARMDYLRDAKYITTGPEPVAAFYLAKESENKNLRMVLTGKLSNLSEETIKERLRKTYV